MDVAPNIRTIREQLNMTQAELARRSGVSKAMVCDVESGRKNPTIRLLGQIAQGLNCGISELLDLDETPTLVVAKADKQNVLIDPEVGMERRLLSKGMARAGVEVLHYTYPPHASCSNFPPHPKGSLETAYVIEGRVRVVAGREESELTTGDAATYAADQEHSIINLEDEPARVIYVTTIPKGR